MEYALGFSLTATFTFIAIWINDTFSVGGELTEEDEHSKDLALTPDTPPKHYS